MPSSYPILAFKATLTGALSLIAIGAASSCSNLADDCENTLTCEEAGDAGDAGACSDPTTQPCAISNERGVFVSAANGSDGDGDGTREKPYRSVSKALTTAKTAKKSVYVCAGAGEYAETQTLTIDATFTGVSLFGGFNCADWTYTQTSKSKIVSASPNAIVIEGVTAGMQIADFEVQASDATQAGTSSLAVQVKTSQVVKLRRVKVSAGAGADGARGADGSKGADGVAPVEDELNGKDAYCPSGPSPRERVDQPGASPKPGSTCGSVGGVGGTAKAAHAQPGGNGASGTPNANPPVTDNYGAGATEAGTDKAGGDGKRGGTGAAGPNGSPAMGAGDWTASGYSPASGQPGTVGSPGQGGGGGGASKSTETCVAASAGAGGMGGCGGGAGRGGGGGGASVALFVWQSRVTLEDCVLLSKDGGAGAKGGDGANGGAGKRGGDGGQAATGVSAAGRGGDGGTGGDGGSGSGGSGGPSYALVAAADAVIQLGTNDLTAGTGGRAGPGGSVGGLGNNAAPSGTTGAGESKLDLP